MTLILYRAPDFLVRFAKTKASPVCMVTFSSLTDDPRLDRPGFGEAMLMKNGIDAIHVINRTNIWYQYPEFPEALRVIAAAAAGHERIITYGSSMGGYAAIRFAGVIGAGTAIAISPQYSVSPRLAPFETRWRPLTRTIRFLHEHVGQEDGAVEPIVFYDPRDRDAEHFRLIGRAYPNAKGIRLPHAGHPAGAFLNETGLLVPAILDIAHGKFDPAVLEQTARASRRSSGQYLFTLARRLPPHHFNVKIRLAEMATHATDDAAYHIYLARLSERARDFTASARQLKKANDVLPEHPVPMRALCTFLLRRENYEEAISLARKLAAIDPTREDFALLLLAALLGHREFELAARLGRDPVISQHALRLLPAFAKAPLLLRGLRPLFLAWLDRRVRLLKELDSLEEYRQPRRTFKVWRHLAGAGTSRHWGSPPGD